MAEPAKPMQVEVQVPDDPKSLEVNLDPKPIEVQKPTISMEEMEKLHKRNEYLSRNLEKSMKRIEELLTQPRPVQQPEPVQQSEDEVLDELDVLAQKDWKAAVKKLGRQEAEAYVREILAHQQQEAKIMQQQSSLDKSRNRVLSEFPDLKDESSELHQLYSEALELEKQDDPDVIYNPRGPEVVRDRMKELARERNVTLKPDREVIDKKVNEEVNRRNRTVASSVYGKPASQSGSLFFELAQRLGIPYEQLAKVKKQGANNYKEGVTVS